MTEEATGLAPWYVTFELLVETAKLDIGDLLAKDEYTSHSEGFSIRATPDLNGDEFLLKLDRVVAKMAVWAARELAEFGGGKMALKLIEDPASLYVGWEIRVLEKD